MLRTLLRAGTAVCALALAGQAAADEKINYMLPAPAVLPAFAPWMLAQYLGYYKAEGYDVTFQVGRGGVDVGKQVGVGNAPVGGGLGDTPILVRANDVPVKAVAVLGGGAMMVVVARADRGIKTLKDLKGKAITTLSFQDTTYFALLGSLAAVGLTTKDLNIQAVGPRGTPGLVLEGKADACACVPDWEIMVKHGLKGEIVSMPSLQYFPSMAQAILASDEMIKTKPKLVEGIVRATLKGVKFIMDDPDKAAAAYVKAVPAHAGKEKLMAEILRNFVERTYKGQTKLGLVDEKRMATVQDFYLKQKVITKATPVAELYTNAFVK
ncbi:MAG: ABC transporter substrate-binding protein [Rhodospirillaceae bacterium]|nr:ABC transporter substrate-binding protein [Rhodospirillaceae bacterium]